MIVGHRNLDHCNCKITIIQFSSGKDGSIRSFRVQCYQNKSCSKICFNTIHFSVTNQVVTIVLSRLVQATSLLVSHLANYTHIHEHYALNCLFKIDILVVAEYGDHLLKVDISSITLQFFSTLLMHGPCRKLC